MTEPKYESMDGIDTSITLTAVEQHLDWVMDVEGVEDDDEPE